MDLLFICSAIGFVCSLLAYLSESRDDHRLGAMGWITLAAIDALVFIAHLK